MQVIARMEKFRSLSRKPTKGAGNVVVMKKVTVATPIPLEVLGLVVLGNIVFVIRNLKLKVN